MNPEGQHFRDSEGRAGKNTEKVRQDHESKVTKSI